MRKIFHNLFPNWISPPPLQRGPTDLERLESLIAEQRSKSINAELQSLEAQADAYREDVYLNRMSELHSKMLYGTGDVNAVNQIDTSTWPFWRNRIDNMFGEKQDASNA